MTDDTPPLWTIKELARVTGGTVLGPDEAHVTGISIDSRTLAAGDAFFAIRGDRFDGHDYAQAALMAGAAVAVVAREHAEDLPAAGGPRLVVDDVLGAMEALGRAARARMQGSVIAVTGSVGKTGTKEALRLALAPSGPVHAADRSFNNHWGVPLTLARMPADAAFGVFEIGMNHPGEIRPLAAMVRPHIAVITTVAAVHLGHFASVEDIARAKAEIFEGVEPGGAVLLNADNEHLDLLRRLARQQPTISRIVTFGRADDADIRLCGAELESTGSSVTATVFGQRLSYRIGAPGAHLVSNSLAVIGAARLAGADMAAACRALAAMTAPKGRGQRHRLAVGPASAVLIDESYNANPASMAAALDLLGQTAPQPGGRRIAVLGDMLELGEQSAAYHADLCEAVARNHVDRLYCCGPMMRHLWERVPEAVRARYATDSAGLGDALLEEVGAGDVVMIKGSLGSRMGPLVESLLSRYPPDTSCGTSA